MERLPKETLESIIGIQKTTLEAFEKHGSEDTDYIPTLDKCILALLEELKQYRIAEEQGLLLRLPIPEGTKVYELIKIVDYGEVGDKGQFKYYHGKTKFDRNMIDDFGKTVFLSEGEAAQKIHDIEAEQALQAMEKK